ncbi:MAG: type II glyceraldehyde-3-phosphate dehydrogenase [Acidiferrobacterales bacterium]|nr:type II glyceraldehyde-3-phosphate dehydrogenase [Acidiferrobacterales bacterium]
MVKVAVVGYGVIGQRLADGVAAQEDMELVGIADVEPTISLRALKERGMPYDLYSAVAEKRQSLEDAGIPVTGTLDELIQKVDIILDATSPGVGAKNKALYEKHGKKAIFQGGEKNDIVDVFFHGYANFEKGLNKDFLKLTSCNTTGLIRTIHWLDQAVGVEKAAITIIRRVADPGDTFRGLTNNLMIEAVPNHQAVDLMTIMPHVDCTGVLVHTPVTHGHIISIVAKTKKDISVDEAIALFKTHPRMKVVKIEDGFDSNGAFFRYARDKGNMRADMYEVGIWEETVAKSGDDLIFSINIPQEAITIPETMDAVRAATGMQTTSAEGTALTNKYLNMSAEG